MQKMMSIFKYFFLPLLAASLVQSGAADTSGTLTAWQGTDEAAVRLIAGPRDNAGLGRVWLGVQIKLGPGWKTYWRNPGESGAPPRFNWEGSENVATAEVRWPAPRRFSAFGYDSFGYHKQVVIPVLLTPTINRQPITTRLNLDYMICANICIPMQAKLTLKLGETDPASVTASLVQGYLELVPKGTEFSGLHIISATVSGDAGLQILRVHGRAELAFKAPDLMVEGPNPFAFGRPKVVLSSNGHNVVMELPVYAGTSKIKLTDQALTLTMVDGKRALEKRLILGR